MDPDFNHQSLVPQRDLQSLRPPGDSFHTAYYQSSPGSHIPSLWDYWRVLLRHKWVIISAVIIAVVMGTVIAVSTKPVYEAVGRIVINREGADTAGLKSSDGGSADSYDDYMVAMDTQTHVLESDAIARLVIRKLNLDTDPAFAGKSVAPVTTPSDPAMAEARNIEPHQEAALMGKFHRSLQINSVPRTRLLEVRFSSTDPNLAAKAVNTVIDTYIEQNYKTHLEATTRTATWLTQQLQELQLKVQDSQEKLVHYQQAHGILGLDEKENIITSKLDELNKELTVAEGDRMQKESLYRMAGSGDPDLLANLDPSSPLVKLRNQEVDLHRQLAQMSVNFEPSYPKVQELNNELKAVQGDINIEVARVSAKFKKDYLTALEREKLLRASLENQKSAENQLNESAIEYSLLKRDVDTNRQLYEGLLQKLKEAGVMTGLRSSNVRIVDSASAPTAPSSPNIPRNIMLSLLMGLAGGIGLAFVLESRDNSVHSLEQAQMVTALPSLAVIPLATRATRSVQQQDKLLAQPQSAVAVTRPKSQIAEAYRALRTSILLSSTGRSAKVLMVTSALPQEGKTTTSVNLAIVLAQHGSRVLLIEADMRCSAISEMFAFTTDSGLSTVLAQGTSVESALRSMPGVPNLSVLPAGPVPVNPSEILASARMREMLAVMRTKFDHIIVDTPPVLNVTDAVLLSALADSTVLVIRSGVTSKAALRRVHEVLSHVNARIMGVVLNGADATEPDRYYYGNRYRAYYDESAKSAAAE